MKKSKCILAVVMAVVLLLNITGCAGGGNPAAETETVPPTTEGRHEVDGAVINAAFADAEYSAGIYTLYIVDILEECARYEAEYCSYEENKGDHMSASDIAMLEQDENYSEYLDNSYFITVTGRILYNPEIPNYYTEQKVILDMLILFDKNDKCVGYWTFKQCDEFYTCAVLMASSW